MKKGQKTTPTSCALPIFVSCAAGSCRPLRYAPRPAGPCATETKTGDQSKKEIERETLPPVTNNQPLPTIAYFNQPVV
jgi:hypothetical protein